METPTKKAQSKQYQTPLKTPSAVRTRTPSLKAIENCFLDPEYSPDLEMATSSNRKSGRKITQSTRYSSQNYETPDLKQRSTRKRIQINYKETNLFSNSDSESDTEQQNTDTSSPSHAVGTSLQNLGKLYDHSELFAETIDVDGKKIYGFNTPKKNDGMLKLALNTPKTPKTPKLMASTSLKTPDHKREKSNTTKDAMCAKTPRHVRTRLKEEITKQILEQTFSDFSDHSDYEMDTSSSTEEENSNSNSSDSDYRLTESNKKQQTTKNSKLTVAPTILTKSPLKISATTNSNANGLLRRSKRLADDDFVPKSDEYFSSYSSKKVITSDHTLDRLKNPRLAADSLFSLLSDLKLSTEHEKCISEIFEEHKSNFSKWMYILNEGFNILLYGLGSKRNLLQCFQREMLENHAVLVINGFFPSLTIKNILDGIVVDILELSSTTLNLHEAVNIIETEMYKIPEFHIFLIIHNIDGPMLRNSKAQELLSRLAKISNIHLLASIDHINTPLLWDHTKLSNYNFAWWDVTTMLPYTTETAFENSLLIQNSGELELSSMRNVFLSLTSNARGIYIIIVKYQLKNKANPIYQGMPIKDLYWGARDAFLVSSDIALRAQLTEFLDHKLVKTKRNPDGSESLQIPIESGLLRQFLEEQEQ